MPMIHVFGPKLDRLLRIYDPFQTRERERYSMAKDFAAWVQRSYPLNGKAA